MAKRLVLAIGHDWRIRKLIRANLEALGLEVRGAVNGRHSLQVLDEGIPDLILLETDLLDAEFSQFLDHLQAQLGCPVPIIVLSAEPPSQQFRKNGQSISYLLKPFAAPTLLQAVKQALGNTPVEKGPAAEGG